MAAKPGKNSLATRRKRLKAHEVKFGKAHAARMKSAMQRGLSFSAAHREALGK